MRNFKNQCSATVPSFKALTNLGPSYFVRALTLLDAGFLRYCTGREAHCTEIDFALSSGAGTVKMINLSKTGTRDFFDIILDQKNPLRFIL